LIKSYFNLSPLYKNKKSTRVETRFKRLSLNRILVSRAEMKHTNSKVIITVYLYNKNKKFFIYKLKNLYKTFLFRIRKNIPSLASSSNRVSLASAPKVYQALLNPTKNTFNGNNARKLMITNITYNALDTKKNKTLSKFSSKRFKKSKRFSTRHDTTKRNYYINYSNTTKINLSRFIYNLDNMDLKNKYKTFIRKYYFLLSNNKLNTISNENYFLNYVNLAKYKSSVNSNKNIYTSTLYLSALKKNTFFSTRRNNNYYKLFQDKGLSFENVFAFKTRKPRNHKNFMHKLRNLHKLFFISKMYNFNKSNNMDLAPNNFLKQSNFLINNLPQILKNKSTLIRKINFISLKGLRILKKARKNKNFLLKILK
jgi:hypothetical protein